MNRQHTHSTLSAILVAAAWVVSIEGNAAPVFPPAHLGQGAPFAAAAVAVRAPSAAPWYFLAQPAPRETVIETVRNAPAVASNAPASPWYRSAN